MHVARFWLQTGCTKMPMPRCSYRSQLDSSKFDTPEKSIAQILSLKHQHVNAARRANKQAATSFSTQTAQTENQHTPATTDNGDNVQRATHSCNMQQQQRRQSTADNQMERQPLRSVRIKSTGAAVSQSVQRFSWLFHQMLPTGFG